MAERIEDALNERGSTKTWLAKKMGITRQSLNYRLKSNNFSAEELLQIAKILEVDLNTWLQTAIGEEI